jgi:integrase
MLVCRLAVVTTRCGKLSTHGWSMVWWGGDRSTVTNRTILARKHLLPALGSRRLTELTADEVDRWLVEESGQLSTDTLAKLLSILRQSIRRAQARDLVQRNVALLCEAPKGTGGRPSKSLSLEQASRLLLAAEGTAMYAYVVVSLLTGARTEELRALTWSRLDLEGDTKAIPPTPPSIQLWRSVRASGETKTKRSRRTLELPALCVDALRQHRHHQLGQRSRMGERWVDNDLVFATRYGTELDAANVRRAFRSVAAAAGLQASEWTPRELRHSFVSLLSSSGGGDRGHCAPSGPCQHECHREGLSQGASTDVDAWRNGHGCVIWWQSSWSVRLAV